MCLTSASSKTLCNHFKKASPSAPKFPENLENILGAGGWCEPNIFLIIALNKRLSNYVSWHPDLESVGVDALNMSWTKLKFYAFPPFSLVGKSISKIIQEKESGIMAILWWPTQNWFLIMTQSLVDYPIILPQKKATLILPFHKNKLHPLFPKLQLLAMRLSGRKAMGNRGLQEEIMDIICLSWRNTTTSRYEGVLRQWKNCCCQRGVDPFVTDVKNVLDFLHGMYKRDVGTVVFAQPEVHFLVL